MKLTRTALWVLVVVCAATVASAQSGGLTIKVLDAADQSPLPGATVVPTNTVQLVAETVVQTNIDGLAEFPILRPGGGYIVQVTMPGYAGVRKDEIRVKLSQSQTIAIPLGEEGAARRADQPGEGRADPFARRRQIRLHPAVARRSDPGEGRQRSDRRRSRATGQIAG